MEVVSYCFVATGCHAQVLDAVFDSIDQKQALCKVVEFSPVVVCVCRFWMQRLTTLCPLHSPRCQARGVSGVPFHVSRIPVVFEILRKMFCQFQVLENW